MLVAHDEERKVISVLYHQVERVRASLATSTGRKKQCRCPVVRHSNSVGCSVTLCCVVFGGCLDERLKFNLPYPQLELEPSTSHGSDEIMPVPVSNLRNGRINLLIPKPS